MSGPQARKLTARLTSLATKVAKKNAQVYIGTVLSRNPDGTLNVDDGRGGCQRVVAGQNVRVGERIVVGTEPNIGQITSLDQSAFTIDGSGFSCPDDQRGCLHVVGVPCPTPTPAPPATPTLHGQAEGFSHYNSLNWNDRDIVIGGGTTGFTTGLVSETALQGAFPGTSYLFERMFVEFDLSSLDIPAEATITAATMRVYLLTAGDSTNNYPGAPLPGGWPNPGTYSALDLDICLVAGLWTPPLPNVVPASTWPDLDRSKLYGRFPIRGFNTGVGPYDLALDPGDPLVPGTLANQIMGGGGIVKIVGIIGNDMDGLPIPTGVLDLPHSGDNKDTIRFNNTTNKPNLLIDYELPEVE